MSSLQEMKVLVTQGGVQVLRKHVWALKQNVYTHNSNSYSTEKGIQNDEKLKIT